MMIAAVCGAIALVVVTDPNVRVDALGEFDAAPLERIEEKYDVYDGEGNRICVVTADGNLQTELSALSDETKHAFIAIEDARFYEHGAVDLQRMGGALLKDLVTASAKEGASTITQQLVKNVYLSPEKTLRRKMKEIRIARGVERVRTKDEILELYLNSLYFGNHIYGVEAASLRFFGKSASELALNESAALAAIINNPGKFDPYRRNEQLEARKRLVLERMLRQKYITREEYTAACKKTEFRDKAADNHLFLQFATGNSPHREIHTAYDGKLQQIAESALDGTAIAANYATAVVVFDVQTEEIVAATSNTYQNLTSVKRQPGSTIKPILCYAPALDDGAISPVTPLLDTPTNFGGYAPRNYEDKYYGWISAADSLSKSLNIPAVKLLNIVGVDRAKQTAEKLGISFSENDNGLALALGGMEYGTDLQSLGRAYCKIAAGGKGCIRSESAYFINKMLQDCAENGTAKRLSGIGNVAAKTGTVGNASGNTDAFCVAYNAKYVVLAWAGSENGYLPSDVTGGTLPAEICADMMKCPALRSEAFAKPKTVVSIDLNAEEMEVRHKIVPAGTTTLPKDRITAEFSIYHLPEKKAQEDLFFGDYDDFKVVDGFVD